MAIVARAGKAGWRPRGRHRPHIWVGVVAGLTGLAFQIGCDLSAVGRISRINHLHNDANQKSAQDALDAFEKFADEESGLSAALLGNLKAQADHERAVTQGREDLADSLQATTLIDGNWRGLRFRFYDDAGVVPRNMSESNADFAKLESEFSRRVGLRVLKVQAASKVFETLILGQQALILQARHDVDRIAKESSPPKPLPTTNPAATRPATSGPAPTTRLVAEDRARRLADLVFDFRAAVAAAAKQQAADARTRAEADALQRALIDAAERSRDPAAAFALVGMVGTGLSDETFALLDQYLLFLDDQIGNFQLPPDDQLPPESEEAWGKFKASVVEAKDVVRRAAQATAAEVVLRTRATSPRALAPAERRRLLALQQSGVRAFTNQRAPNDAALEANLGTLGLDRAVANASLSQLSGSIATTVQSLGVDVRQLGSLIEKIAPAPVQGGGGGAGAGQPPSLESIKNIEDAKNAGYEYLRKTLAANPALIGALEDALQTKEGRDEFDKNLEQLGKIVKEIGDEKEAATRRVLQFLADLYKLQLDLDEENLRHDQALAAIAVSEIKRWNLISDLRGKYDNYFAPSADPAAGNPGTRPIYSLFSTPAQRRNWDAALPAGQTLPAGRRHAAFDDTAPVLASVRRLAETAREWQYASPNADDPDGVQTRGSNNRLYEAVKVIEGNLLVTSLNRRLADENGLRLRTELQEHDLHADMIVARAQESGLRIGLQELLAFHSSGITDADIQAAIGIVQQVWLARISSKL